MQAERSGSGYWFVGLVLVWAALLFGGFLLRRRIPPEANVTYSFIEV